MNDPSLFDSDDGVRGPDKSGATPGATGASARDLTSHDHLIKLPLRAPARRNAPRGTSRVAADRIAPHAAKQRANVLAVIASAGDRGATDAEIELVTGMRAQSVSPRRGELVKLRLVVDSGQRRNTPRGRPAAVWVLSGGATSAPHSTPNVPRTNLAAAVTGGAE